MYRPCAVPRACTKKCMTLCSAKGRYREVHSVHFSVFFSLGHFLRHVYRRGSRGSVDAAGREAERLSSRGLHRCPFAPQTHSKSISLGFWLEIPSSQHHGEVDEAVRVAIGDRQGAIGWPLHSLKT